MPEVNVRVLSADSADSLGFAKISEFNEIESVDAADYLLVSGHRAGEEYEITRKVKIADIAQYFIGDVNINMQWFIPYVSNGLIHWKFVSLSQVGDHESDMSASDPILPIDITELIGDATDQKSGLLNPTYKQKLDSLVPAAYNADGLMSKEDKSKLDGIEAGANNYVLPIASTEVLGGIKIDGRTIVIDANGVIRSNAGVPESKRCVLPANGWNSNTLTQKLEMELDITLRNSIDVDPASMDVWLNNRIYAISEASDGITFRCSTIPTNDVVIYVITSMVTIVE